MVYAQSGDVPQESIHPGLEGQELLDALRTDYSPDQTLGYTDARDTLFAYLSEERGELRGVYTGYAVSLDPNEDPTQDAFDKGINTEHTWPQSRGAGEEPARSDLHALYPTRENVNSARQNDPFTEIPDAETDTWYCQDEVRQAIPTSNIDCYSEDDNTYPGESYGVNSGDLLELYRAHCDPEMHYRKYSERDGLARKIHTTGIPEEILRMARRMKVAPDTFSGDWVYLINGESANRRNRQATVHEDRMTEADNYEPTIPAPESAQVIQKYLNHMLDPQLFSHGGYGVMAKLDDAIERVHELKGEPSFDSEEKVDTALRTLLWMRQYPTPVYVPCDGSPRLKVDHFNQAMNLSSEIRPALYTTRDVELDGAKMHMASLPVVARREGLSAPTVERYLKASLDGKDLWTELASHFDTKRMPDAKARRKAAKISYSAVYGVGESYMFKCIVDRYGGLTGRWVGFDAVEGILAHELIAEVFEVREQLFDRIWEQGFLEDAYGWKIRPEDFLTRPKIAA